MKHRFLKLDKSRGAATETICDWPDDLPEHEVEVDADRPLGIVDAACQRWMEHDGHLIIAEGWGVRSYVAHNVETRKSGRLYQAFPHCCPLGVILHDTWASAGALMVDAAQVLAVDYYWIMGFMHYVSKTFLLSGKRHLDFLESSWYRAGRDAAVEIKSRFIRARMAT